jgi:hypothetical protein
MAQSIDPLYSPNDVLGVLGRNVPARLIEISRSGCLLESRERVEDGTVGELRLQVGGETFVDDVRITRCVLVEGSGSCYRVGAEFVQTRRPGEKSIRRAVAAILREVTGAQKVPDLNGSSRNGAKVGAIRAPHVNSVRSTGEEVS